MAGEPFLVGFAQALGRDAIRAAISAFVKRRQATVTRNRRKLDSAIEALTGVLDERALAMHVAAAYRWASQIHTQGMGQPTNTEDASVALAFTPAARRFRGTGAASPSGQFDERELVTSNASYLILGDPGAGKTTTLKRLTLSLFEESTVARSGSDVAMPVFLLCRELQGPTELPTEILDRFGLDVARVRGELGTTDEVMYGLTAALLDELGVMLVVDGIDEIPSRDGRRALLDSLAKLERLTSKARLVCSARSGDAPHLEGFSVAELLPLSWEQVREITTRRTACAERFLDAVADSPVRELLDRPLFLNQLLTVYETTGALPDRPVDLYRNLVRLLLHEWDEQRRVTRASAYANFDNSAKQDFLAEIAFRLTTRGRATFSEEELLGIYDVIAPSFGLPQKSGRQVVREIESHVGIVAETAAGYQFSHLTLQEYLCAESIVRRAMNDEVADYMRTHPAVIAVAVALSSRPDEYLIECHRRSKRFEATGDVDAFVRRLGLEQPRFEAGPDLGEVFLDLMSQARDHEPSNWRRLAAMPAVRASVELTRERFHFDRVGAKVKYSRPQCQDHTRRRRLATGHVALDLFQLFSTIEPQPAE